MSLQKINRRWEGRTKEGMGERAGGEKRGEKKRRKERGEGRKTVVATMVHTNRLVGLRPTLVTCVGGHCHHRFDLCCPGNDPSYSNQLPNAVRLYFAN